jgi:uncharacterized protein YjbJ (UPF0337 family)
MLVEPKPMNPRVRRLWRFLCLCSLVGSAPWRILAGSNPVEVDLMGFLDRLLGRTKKEPAGDMMGDASMRREGAAQEREAAAQEPAEQHEQMGHGQMAQEQPDQAAEPPAERDDM